MKTLLIIWFLIFCFYPNFAQNKIEDDIASAVINAKKGIYWALSNIPSKKAKVENDLIANDKLYSKVKLEKGIGGIKIEATGYHETNSVTIVLYRSYDSLKKDGYIKKIDETDLE